MDKDFTGRAIDKHIHPPISYVVSCGKYLFDLKDYFEGTVMRDLDNAVRWPTWSHLYFICEHTSKVRGIFDET